MDGWIRSQLNIRLRLLPALTALNDVKELFNHPVYPHTINPYKPACRTLSGSLGMYSWIMTAHMS